MLDSSFRGRGGYNRGDSRGPQSYSRERAYDTNGAGSQERVYNSRERVYHSQEHVYKSQERFNYSKDFAYDSKSSTLPRSKPNGTYKEDTVFYGSLPRPGRGGRQRTYSGGEQGTFRGRGRGRGAEMRAPSQRRIYKQKETKRETIDRTVRAQSVPKQSLESAALPASKSMLSIWTPDGRCPSFADILKRSHASDEMINRGNYYYQINIFYQIILLKIRKFFKRCYKIIFHFL